jgi:hypothetical protein
MLGRLRSGGGDAREAVTTALLERWRRWFLLGSGARTALAPAQEAALEWRAAKLPTVSDVLSSGCYPFFNKIFPYGNP